MPGSSGLAGCWMSTAGGGGGLGERLRMEKSSIPHEGENEEYNARGKANMGHYFLEKILRHEFKKKRLEVGGGWARGVYLRAPVCVCVVSLCHIFWGECPASSQMASDVREEVNGQELFVLVQELDELQLHHLLRLRRHLHAVPLAAALVNAIHILCLHVFQNVLAEHLDVSLLPELGPQVHDEVLSLVIVHGHRPVLPQERQHVRDQAVVPALHYV
mmetsp:Transcript_68428/g.109445  ORF Transcript_68428/g.109445 Transcript_68428/m.109445 type:complete len:217 (-) Transcript_68428:625-1275(-)